MKQLQIVLVTLLFCASSYSQSCTGTSLGTPGLTNVCLDFDASPAGSGSSSCAGGGFGGAGTFRIIRVCTNSSNQCIQVDLTGIASANGTDIALYTTCSAGIVSGYVAGSANCYTGTTAIGWSTAGLPLAANTCYFMRIWTKDPPTTTAVICAHSESPLNDFCTAPQQIGTTSSTYDNYCMTAGSIGDPAPAQFCAGSLENNAWFSFTTLSTCTFPCSVTITISGISCSGGGGGFQIGYWTGICGSLSNIGCSSGAGGTVTATITNLNPNQRVIVGLDGNAGAYCNFAISATNVVGLPVGLHDFTASYDEANNVLLNWKTLSETNNSYFTIERSTDGEIWTNIETISGAGNSTEMIDYSTVDRNAPTEVTLYYKLSQTDNNGMKQDLKVVSVNPFKRNSELIVVPNPVINGNAQIKFKSEVSDLSIMTIVDFTGKIVYSQEFETIKGENIFEFETSDLSKGIYLTRITNDTEINETKFVVN